MFKENFILIPESKMPDMGGSWIQAKSGKWIKDNSENVKRKRLKKLKDYAKPPKLIKTIDDTDLILSIEEFNDLLYRVDTKKSSKLGAVVSKILEKRNLINNE